jgi:hypothetical protein
MKLKPEGTWKNSKRLITITLTSIPGKSDVYSIEYSEGENISNDQIHISNMDGTNWHLMANDILGVGFIKFTSNTEMEINSSKIDGIKFIKV